MLARAEKRSASKAVNDLMSASWIGTSHVGLAQTETFKASYYRVDSFQVQGGFDPSKTNFGELERCLNYLPRSSSETCLN